MSDLSDLDLVAQAMASSEPRHLHPISAAIPSPNGTSDNADSSNSSGLTSSTNPTTASDISTSLSADTSDIITSLPADIGIDLSKLTPEELVAVQPLIDALRLADIDADGDAPDEDVAEILKAMDAAGEVADALEGRLNGLLERLQEFGGEIEGDLGAVVVQEETVVLRQDDEESGVSKANGSAGV